MFYRGKRDFIIPVFMIVLVVLLVVPLFTLNEYSKENLNLNSDTDIEFENEDIVKSECELDTEKVATLKNITFTDKKPRKDCSAGSGNLCFSKVFKPEPISKEECKQIQYKLGIKECGFDDDVWAGAVKECGGVQRMASPEDLAYLAEVLYKLPCGGHPKIYPNEAYNGKAQFDKNKAEEFGLNPLGYISLWSNMEATEGFVAKPGEYVYARNFFPQSSNWYPYERYGKGNARLAVCVYRD